MPAPCPTLFLGPGSSLTLHLKQLEKEEQTKAEVKRKEIIKIRAVINEIETKNMHL